MLPFNANSAEKIEEITPGAKPFRVILGDFVTTEDGTGIVHTSPAFGADDYRVGKKNNLGILTLVDKQGKFVDSVGEFSGRFVKNYKDEADYIESGKQLSYPLRIAPSKIYDGSGAHTSYLIVYLQILLLPSLPA